VRLACHPHDPYTPAGWRGITRVLGSVEGVKRFVTMHESPFHGLNFCQGTVAAMLDDPGREIFDVIRGGDPGDGDDDRDREHQPEAAQGPDQLAQAPANPPNSSSHSSANRLTSDLIIVPVNGSDLLG
jgi:hypothetical protein